MLLRTLLRLLTVSAAISRTDPPALENVTDFSKPPNVKLGTLKVSPELRFKEMVSDDDVYHMPFLDFVCKETGGDNKTAQTLIYTTYWYINDELTFTNHSTNGLSILTEEILLSKNMTLGIQVRCAAKLAWSATGLQTKLTTSVNYFAGVEVKGETVVSMSRNESRKISFQPTVPYGCYSAKKETTPGACKTKVNMVVPDPNSCDLADTDTGGRNVINYHNSMQALCGFEIEGCYRNELPCTKTMQVTSMNITTPFFSYDDPNSYRLKLEVQPAQTHEIWKGYNITEVVVNIEENIDYKDKVCFSHVDPHMQTADGMNYENNDFEGDFILYWNTEYNIMVQEKTTKCNNDKAYCTCAVAVRAGGDIFLINMCNGKKFIGMTSCKDNGALVIRKYSEVDYQVQTNIGTSIKIRMPPNDGYDNYLNIDIGMAPKDYLLTKGLCGTFDGDKENDFHDRNGNVLNRIQFIEAWNLTETDKNYLNTTCNYDVKTWEEDGQQLFCSCNCYGDEKPSCGTPETKSICSPSQYINCTVNLQKTDDLCKEFSQHCKPENRRRRSAFTVDPEKEMQRKAALAKQSKAVRKRRQSSIQMEEAKKLCTDGISKSLAVAKYSNLLGGYNHSVIIDHCVFDVYEGQDKSWLGAHKVAVNDAVQLGFKRNANYTEAHKEDLIEFKKQYCPSDCHGNGNCTDEGICSCAEGYFGPDCRNSITKAPRIEDVEGGGVCDIRFGSECKCFEVQVDVLSELFYCRRNTRSVYVNGSSTTNKEEQVNGFYKNIFTGECCFDSHRDKRSVNVVKPVMFYEFDVSLSNDGANFSPVETLHVYDSLCQEISDIGTVLLKEGTCFINEYCVEGGGTEIVDSCKRCLPKQDQFEWTNDCKEKDDRDQTVLILVLGVVVVSIIVCTVTVTVWLICIKKRKNHCRYSVESTNIASSKLAHSKARGIKTCENPNYVNGEKEYSSQPMPTNTQKNDREEDLLYEGSDKKNEAVPSDTLDRSKVRANELTSKNIQKSDSEGDVSTVRTDAVPYETLDQTKVRASELMYTTIQKNDTEGDVSYVRTDAAPYETLDQRKMRVSELIYTSIQKKDTEGDVSNIRKDAVPYETLDQNKVRASEILYTTIQKNDTEGDVSNVRADDVPYETLDQSKVRASEIMYTGIQKKDIEREASDVRTDAVPCDTLDQSKVRASELTYTNIQKKDIEGEASCIRTDAVPYETLDPSKVRASELMYTRIQKDIEREASGDRTDAVPCDTFDQSKVRAREAKCTNIQKNDTEGEASDVRTDAVPYETLDPSKVRASEFIYTRIQKDIEMEASGDRTDAVSYETLDQNNVRASELMYTTIQKNDTEGNVSNVKADAVPYETLDQSRMRASELIYTSI